MSRTLTPHEAQALLDAGGVDVVDVRDPYEFAEGHVPRARNVPLSTLRAAPKQHLPPANVLLVCARGVRSETAASLAEEAGVTGVHHLAGGTDAWTRVGLPLEGVPAPRVTSQASGAVLPTDSDGTLEGDASCGLPMPGLDAIVGENMRALRSQRGMSLDQLARVTGLSRSLLGQIELGKTPPSVSIVWRIAQAFDVHFSALLATGNRGGTTVLRAADAKRLESQDGRFSSRALYPLVDRPDAEFYELYLAPHSREDALAHQPGTRENLVVKSGKLDLFIGTERIELGTGDAIVFTADVPHAYVNPAAEPCWMYLVMTYVGGAPTSGS